MLMISASPSDPQPVLLLGEGLIGGEILRAFEREGRSRVVRHPTHWNDVSARRAQFDQVAAALERAPGFGEGQIHFIWAAGVGGFGSSEAELGSEQQAFEDALDLFERLTRDVPGRFHFLSSAGGLFEGQTQVDLHSQPAPRRPYGFMKLRQEEMLVALATGSTRGVDIYRPSTVYGNHDFGDRKGLISNLVWYALLNQAITLEPVVDAMRDFVFARDVGLYLASQTREPVRSGVEVHFLVSGKPSTIFEIVQRVQGLSGRRLLVRYASAIGNDAKITFNPSVRPSAWRPSGLAYGIAEVYRQARGQYFTGAAVDHAKTATGCRGPS